MSDEMECPKDCCEDTEQSFKVDDLVKTSFEFKHEIIVTAFVADHPVFLITSLVENDTFNKHINYNPPLLTQYIPTRDQCFLL